MRWRVTSRFRGKGVNTQVGLILFALLAGLLVPLLAAVFLAGRDQLPRSCRSGVSTSTLTEGAVTWSSGAVLWSATTGNCVYDAAAVSNGMVYVGSEDQNLYAYALNGGNDAAYRGKRKPPAISSLHPDWSLTPAKN